MASSKPSLSFRSEMQFEYGVPGPIIPGVVRLVANNPGPFTFKGTNTYVVGSTSLAVVDPGPEDPSHLDAIMAYANGRPITHILITHTHRDHVDGLPALLGETDALVCGFGRKQLAHDPRISSLTGRSYIDLDFEPDIALRDGDRLQGDGWAFDVLHTPGHAPDHLCFEWKAGRVLFCGDHVMGWNTTVVAPPEGHMGDYLASLEKLAACEVDLFLPGHGGRIGEPRKVSKAYLVHRRLREQAILDAIRSGNDTITKVVALVYKSLDERLVTAAKMSVQAHIEHLVERGLVSYDQTLAFDTPLVAQAAVT